MQQAVSEIDLQGHEATGRRDNCVSNVDKKIAARDVAEYFWVCCERFSWCRTFLAAEAVQR